MKIYCYNLLLQFTVLFINNIPYLHLLFYSTFSDLFDLFLDDFLHFNLFFFLLFYTQPLTIIRNIYFKPPPNARA